MEDWLVRFFLKALILTQNNPGFGFLIRASHSGPGGGVEAYGQRLGGFGSAARVKADAYVLEALSVSVSRLRGYAPTPHPFTAILDWPYFFGSGRCAVPAGSRGRCINYNSIILSRS